MECKSLHSNSDKLVKKTIFVIWIRIFEFVNSLDIKELKNTPKEKIYFISLFNLK